MMPIEPNVLPPSPLLLPPPPHLPASLPQDNYSEGWLTLAVKSNSAVAARHKILGHFQ